MSTYVDSNGNTVGRATVTISEEPKSFKVTYRGDGYKKFSVIVRQKSNPIGFAAKLPGDSITQSGK